MIRLVSNTVLSGQLLQAVLAGAVSANQPEATTSYFDMPPKDTASIDGQHGTTYQVALNSNTDVTIVSPPGAQPTGTTGQANYVRMIDYVGIYNKDTASVNIIVKIDDAGTEKILIRATLLTLESLYYEHGRGWYAVDANGNTKESATSINSSAVLGTTTNDNAGAGRLGELISSTVLVAGAVSLTNGVNADVTSISLTAGDWDVWGNISTNPNAATTQSNLLTWINTVSATLPTFPNEGAANSNPAALAAGTITMTMFTGQKRISVASTTTVYLSVNCSFAVNTQAAYGYLAARRRR